MWLRSVVCFLVFVVTKIPYSEIRKFPYAAFIVWFNTSRNDVIVMHITMQALHTLHLTLLKLASFVFNRTFSWIPSLLRNAS